MKIKILFSAILIIAMCSELASSETGVFGVSPSVIKFENVIRGGYAERPITISYNQDQQIRIDISAQGEIASWLNFTKNSTVSKSKFGRQIVSVSPPSDIPNGEYTGMIVFSISALDSTGKDGNAVSKIISVLQIATTVEIIDREILACTSKNFIIDSAEKGDDINFNLTILNEGNIRIKPELKLKLWDQEQNYIVEELDFIGSEILPTREQTINFSFNSANLEPNQYWAYIENPGCYFTDTQPFDVLEPGAIKSNLVLLRMYNPPFGIKSETIPVIIDYSNNGEKNVEAQFKGQISLDGKVIQLLESDKFSSQSGETNNITLYFTPKKIGKYVISGRIFYDKKRTFESSSTINILKNESVWKTIATYAIYLAIIIIIVVLLLAIRRERKEYQIKINSLKLRK